MNLNGLGQVRKSGFTEELVLNREVKERRNKLAKMLHRLALEAGAIMAIIIICAVLTLGIILISINQGPMWVIAVLAASLVVTVFAGAYLRAISMWQEERQEY